VNLNRKVARFPPLMHQGSVPVMRTSARITGRWGVVRGLREAVHGTLERLQHFGEVDVFNLAALSGSRFQGACHSLGLIMNLHLI